MRKVSGFKSKRSLLFLDDWIFCLVVIYTIDNCKKRSQQVVLKRNINWLWGLIYWHGRMEKNMREDILFSIWYSDRLTQQHVNETLFLLRAAVILNVSSLTKCSISRIFVFKLFCTFSTREDETTYFCIKQWIQLFSSSNWFPAKKKTI